MGQLVVKMICVYHVHTSHVLSAIHEPVMDALSIQMQCLIEPLFHMNAKRVPDTTMCAIIILSHVYVKI
jgi:hypothetical protein